MKKSLILLILPLLLAAGCGNENAPVVVEPSLEDLVIANCYILQQAVEAFAARNNRAYPWNVTTDQNLDGNTVWELLPGAVLLENPFTNLPSEPVDGAALLPGKTGYTVRTIAGQTPVDYFITGFGESDIIIMLTKDGLQ